MDFDAVREAIDLEKQLHPDESSEEMAERLLHESLPFVVRSMCELATQSRDLRIRIATADYIFSKIHDRDDILEAFKRALGL